MAKNDLNNREIVEYSEDEMFKIASSLKKIFPNRSFDEILRQLSFICESKNIKELEELEKYLNKFTIDEIKSMFKTADGVGKLANISKKLSASLKPKYISGMSPKNIEKIKTLYLYDEISPKADVYIKLLRPYIGKKNSEMPEPVADLINNICHKADVVSGKGISEFTRAELNFALQLMKGNSYDELTPSQKHILFEFFKACAIKRQTNRYGHMAKMVFGDHVSNALNAINIRGLGLSSPAKKLSIKMLSRYADYFEECLSDKNSREISNWVYSGCFYNDDSIPSNVYWLLRDYKINDAGESRANLNNEFLFNSNNGMEYYDLFQNNPHILNLFKEMHADSIKEIISVTGTPTEQTLLDGLLATMSRNNVETIIGCLSDKYGFTRKISNDMSEFKPTGLRIGDRLQKVSLTELTQKICDYLAELISTNEVVSKYGIDYNPNIEMITEINNFEQNNQKKF